MQPTSEERREVAERLRMCAQGVTGTGQLSMFLASWVGAEDETGENPFTVEANRMEAQRTLERLADLIDPTCHNTLPRDWGTFECSECGAQFEVNYVFMTASGNDDSEPVVPRFCPECGARVVDDAEVSE